MRGGYRLTSNLQWMDRARDEGFPTAHRILFDRTGDGKSDEYKFYRTEFVRRGAELDAKNFPIHLDVESSASCNEYCPQCFRQSTIFKNTGPPSGNMSRETFDIVMKQCAPYMKKPLYSIKFNSRGEATMSSDLERFADEAKLVGFIDVGMNTNGMFDRARLPAFMKSMDMIAFSIDAAKPETFKKIRVGGNWDVVTGNVKAAIGLKKECGYKTDIRVSFTHMILNADEVDEFESYWKEQGVDKVTVNICFNPAMANPREKYRFPYKVVQSDDFRCGQPFQRLVVRCDGSIAPCCGDFAGFYPLGDVYRDTIYDVWNGAKMTELRRITRDGLYKTFPMCATCGVSQCKETRRKDNNVV